MIPNRTFIEIEEAFREFQQHELRVQTPGGAIFRVQEPGMARKVEYILKLLRAPEEPREALASRHRFQRERRLPQAHPHDNIVTIGSRFGERQVKMSDGGSQLHYFYTMEVCDGDLETALRGQYIPLQTRVSYIANLLDAMSYLHLSRVAHRDIKPKNLLIARAVSGTAVKLADFGLAVELDGDSSVAISPDEGTPQYRAPECVPKAANLNYPACDQFSAGVTIYQILGHGRLPWPRGASDGVSAVAALRYEPLVVIDASERDREPRPRPAPRIEAVLQRMMAVDPLDRYRNIVECKAALRAALLRDGLPCWSVGKSGGKE